MLETVADKGGRSGIIDNAIKVYVKDLKRKALRQQLKEGALARAERDLAMADEWFDAENELWLK
ncbi:MAG: hypothetical protein UZ17_ACD001001476 [Acidobacteria bacterium OLB17]|nr:MAG: hypothetical protein UZ17_ACD001001476 [Acidobacteria bacterium OLB17]